MPGRSRRPVRRGFRTASGPPRQASPTYPGQLQKDLGMPCAPPCTLCHRDQNGGLCTVDKPFGLSMYGAGLRGQSPDGLRAAEKTLESANRPSTATATACPT